MRRRGVKITLGEAARQGDRIVTFACWSRRLDRGGMCGHEGQARLIELIDGWGPDIRLDELPARCSACGGNDVDVRSRGFLRATGHPTYGDLIEDDGLPDPRGARGA